MIDRKLLLHDFDACATRLARKGVAREELSACVDLIEKRGALTRQVEDARATVKASSKEIGLLMRDGRGDDAAALKARVADAKASIDGLEDELRKTESTLDDLVLRIPNFPADDVPDGVGEADNVVLRHDGPDAASYAGKDFLPHWEVATALGIYDGERGAKISGSMFAVLRGDGARLLRALVQFALDLNRDTYEEILPPHFVNSATFTATGQLPKFAEDAYHIESDDLWAIPTGEVPIMGLHRGEILEESQLPLRYMAYTACFRREAGSAGKDTRGMQRLHEFHKVELVKLCTAERVQAEHQAMLADAERPLQALGLPYRIVDQCTGDLPFSATCVKDIEVYAPGADKWLEVSSVGVFSDFQARRGNIRYRPAGGGKPVFVHALNGSGMATPRVWAALIEHGRQADGSVTIPEPLRPYMGADTIRPR